MPRKKYMRRRHSVSLLHAHLVFCVKYRRKVITPRVFDLIRRSFRKTAADLGLGIEALEADGNHLHVLLLHPPKLALAKIVQRLKGASSRLVRKGRLPEVLRKLWGAHFWSPSYFVVSCGGAPLEIVKAYVDNQQSPERRRESQLEPPERDARAQEGSPRNAALTRSNYPRGLSPD